MTEQWPFGNIRAVELSHRLTPSADARFLRLPFSRMAALSLRAAGDMGKSSGGNSRARIAILREFGLDYGWCATNKQVHSRDIVVYDAGRRELVREEAAPEVLHGEEPVEADGIIVSGAGRKDIAALGVTVADCLPLFLFDHGSGATALLHSGWKGTGILYRALELLRDRFGAEPAAIELLIGPGIGPCCYRVDRKRAEQLSVAFGTETVQKRKGECYLDLPAANLNIARSFGVGSICTVRSCTQCGPAFHSFRRDGAERYGHMLALCAVA